MSKYSAAPDGKGNVKVFRTDSGVLSYTLNKGAKTKINNVTVSGKTLTVNSTSEHGLIKTDVYKDINKGILSYSNVVGCEARDVPVNKSYKTSSSGHSAVTVDSTDVSVYIWIVAAVVVLFIALVFPLLTYTAILGTITYYLGSWFIKKESTLDVVNIYLMAYLYYCVYKEITTDYPHNSADHSTPLWWYTAAATGMALLITYGSKKILDNIMADYVMTIGLLYALYFNNSLWFNQIALKLYHLVF